MNATQAPPEAQRPLLILGSQTNSSDLALRRLLHGKQRDQALLVLDYQGALAAQLTERNRGNLHKTPLLWCDLANRRRPVGLFRFAATAGMSAALHAFIARCAQILTVPVTASAVECVVGLATRLVGQGRIGLAALARALRRPELLPLRTARADVKEPADLTSLANMLEWLLAFPAIWALSEGNNTHDLNRVLQMHATVWFELPVSHFERVEHQIAACMIEAVVLDLLLTHGIARRTGGNRPGPVRHGQPVEPPLTLTEAQSGGRHVACCSLVPGRPLPSAAKEWCLNRGAHCWVAGSCRRASRHECQDRVQRRGEAAVAFAARWGSVGALRKHRPGP